MRQQADPLVVYATEKTRMGLDWIDAVLRRFHRIEWRTMTCDFQSLGNGLVFRAIDLGQSVALQLYDEVSRLTALVAPGCR
jgi:hypothetical protein